MRTGIVVQARMSSTRLPGKVLKELPKGSGITVVERVVTRVRRAHSADDVVVATSTAPGDDLIAEQARALGVKCFRGSLDDVLGRFVGAVEMYGLDRVIRITCDCPCVDPAVIDAAAALHERTGADYTSNVVPRTFPKGLDVEVIEATALKRVDAEARCIEDREHVLTYVYRTRPDRFHIANLEAPPELTDPELRVTLDTQADYSVLCAVYEGLGHDFDTAALLGFIGAHSQLRLVGCSEEE